jgi:hypothetical protein
MATWTVPAAIHQSMFWFINPTRRASRSQGPPPCCRRNASSKPPPAPPPPPPPTPVRHALRHHPHPVRHHQAVLSLSLRPYSPANTLSLSRFGSSPASLLTSSFTQNIFIQFHAQNQMRSHINLFIIYSFIHLFIYSFIHLFIYKQTPHHPDHYFHRRPHPDA